MGLFRKSKAARGATSADATEQTTKHQPLLAEDPDISPLPPPPPPPPVLQLDFELPPAPPSNLNLDGPVADVTSGDRPLFQHQQQYGVDAGGSTPAHGFNAAINMGDQVGGSHAQQGLLASDMQRIAAAYSFDYPFQLAEDSSQSLSEEDSVQRQLAEQFGHGPKAHRTTPQPQLLFSQSNVGYNTTTPSAPASQAASKPSPSQGPSQMHQQLARVVMHSMQMATANRTTTFTSAPSNQLSHSSAGSSASSESESGVQKLCSSMAAMSLSRGVPPTDVAAGGKMSDRALQIQKVREASALGKTVAFSKPAYSVSTAGIPAAVDREEDDDDDLVPLGGLRKPGNSSVPNIAMACGNGTQASMVQQQHAALHGHVYPSPVVYDGAANTAKQFAPQHALSMHNLQLQQQQQPYSHLPQTMHSPSAASVASQMSAPMVMRGTAHYGGYPGGTAPPIAYSRVNAAVGGTSSAYSNVGYTRALGMPDQALHAYTPSPLGQTPVYSQPAMVSHQQMPPGDMHHAHYPPVMMGHTGMPAANQQVYPQRAQQYQFQQHPPYQQQLPPPQQPHTSQQPAALTSFIPTQLACRGSLAKNPLMRDINKLKNFSAKDYTARPTLLAEVDSRQQAKKNMPGLGGATSHSYQPEAPPPTLQPQQPLPPPPEPLPQQHGHQQTFRQHDQTDYRDHYPRSDRYEASHGHHDPRSCQNFAEDDDDYSSLSSRTSGRRYHGARGGGGRRPKRHNRYDQVDNAHESDYGAMQRPRESRRMGPPSFSSGRRVYEQRRPHRLADRYYEDYGYEERPDTYARGYYDELADDDEFDERYGDRYDRRPAGSDYSRRRNTQRRLQVTEMRVDRARHDPRWAPPYHGRGNAHGRYGYHSRLRSVHLDDPRDGDSIIITSSRPPTGRDGSSDSESLLVLEHGKPRSQFGRILANLKRQTSSFAPMSPKATVHSVQIREAKVAEAKRTADDRIVEVCSENEGAAKSMSVSTMLEESSVQPSQAVAATTEAVTTEEAPSAEDKNTPEVAPMPPTPVTTSAVPAAAT